MSLKVRVLSSLLLLAMCSAARAVPITYDLGAFSNGTSTLSGTLTTDGTIGSIAAGNITAWSFTMTGANTLAISSSDAGAQSQCLGTSGCFTATLTTLSFNFASLTANDPFASFSSSVGGVLSGVLFTPSFQGPISANKGLGTTDFNPSSNVIGTAPAPSPAPVPEPATLLLLSTGLVVVGMRRRLKMRR